ncbi:MAG: DHH family phosphoesterase [Lachnospiraceae bacterium]|nr:DHH family phosphoesterase [Lachnospiraceae bacterium]
MRLSDLLEYESIVVQCHDNPDADAIASGYGVYMYFRKKRKNVRLVYGGQFVIQKSNLGLMIRELEIPIEHVARIDPPELLITVDCQYGEGNVTHFDAKAIAVIDHHQVGGALPRLSEVRSGLGACSTLVRELLAQEGMDMNDDINLATALYYGLMMDTDRFSEISHPLDKDLRDDAAYDRNKIAMLRNANISLEELEIAGEALCGYEYEEKHRYAVIPARPCDPNILGIIADMMLEVDAVDYCVVYSILPFGIKLSVRSCKKETRANELADYLTENIGSGGGHVEKAGGFIRHELLLREYGADCTKEQCGAFFKTRLNQYFDESEVIDSEVYTADMTQMQTYRRKDLRLGYVKASQIYRTGTQVMIRTLEGDVDLPITDDMYIMIGVSGEVYTMEKEEFERNHKALDEPYVFAGEYQPTLRRSSDGSNISLIPYAKACVAADNVEIRAKQLTHRVKVFSRSDRERYMLGKRGDYLAVRGGNPHDVYVIAGDMFERIYGKKD